MPKKAISTKVYVAIVLLVLLVGIAVAVVVYTTQTSSSSVVPGVKVGDAFTYKLTGTSVLGSADANPDTEYPHFEDLNNTDYYQVTITAINGSTVSLDTLWRFNNGTEVTSPQTIDISNGQTSDTHGFWALYASNLNVNDLLRPKGYDTLIVNSTDTQTYTSSTRTRNFWSIDNTFVDINDPTGNTLREDYMYVYFDKQTGMLDTLTNVQQYNNPGLELIITWQLTNSTVWGV